MGRWNLKKQIIELKEENKLLRAKINNMAADVRNANEFAVEVQRVSSYVCCGCVLRELCKNYDVERTMCPVYLETAVFKADKE